MDNLSSILSEFDIESENISGSGETIPSGHINDTYRVELSGKEYVLQKINHNIFSDVSGLMKNIHMVTEHLRKKIRARGGDENRETLTVLLTKSGSPFLKTKDGSYFRLYKYITNTDTYQQVENKKQLYYVAKAFGRFQNDLADFPAEKLTETILNFHNTKSRFEALVKAAADDIAGRKKDVLPEIEFVLSKKEDTELILNCINSGEIPLRVTHNDTKLNNILFEKGRDTAVCVVDLDTVMPGSMLYDFGDAIRFGASSAEEDETDLDKIYCDLELFESFTKGFLEEVAKSMTKKEIELLAFSAKLITLEVGMRFLTDHLNGDVYFKVHKPNHNLDRARNQFKLVMDMENKMEEMNNIVNTLIKAL